MISLPQFNKGPPSADCGTCTHCCDAIGVIELGKPFFARCSHLKDNGCGIYDTRPGQCRSYRCVWHLGILGERVDRRPDQAGVLFQFEQLKDKWHLGIYEVVPGALANDRTRYLRDMILSSKKIAHMPMGDPPARYYPFGADIPPDYPVSQAYRHYVAPPPPVLLRRDAAGHVFAGKTRGMLMPNADSLT
jgi:hypothetical protein